MSGVRRAAVMESAAIARCTTRKSVHQYPNDSTNPSPIASPNHSTPIGLFAGSLTPRHAFVYASDGSRSKPQRLQLGHEPAPPSDGAKSQVHQRRKTEHDQEELKHLVVDGAGKPAEGD